MAGSQSEMPDDDGFTLHRPGVWHYIAQLPTWLAASMLFLLMAMTFFDVMLRSVANNPIEAATELTRFFMAIIVFSALPMVSWQGRHIVVDLMDPLFSRRMARFRDILIDLFCGVILFWPAKRVWDLAERARDFGDTTEYLGFPQFIVGWFIAFFAFVTAIVFILRGLARIFFSSKVPG